MALQHFSGHFGRGQLTNPHCSWASLLGSLPVTDNCPSWISGRERNYFMTNLHDRMWPYVRMEPATARIPVGRASDRATAPGALWLGYIDHTHVYERIWTWTHHDKKKKNKKKNKMVVVLCWCLMALRHIAGYFGCGKLTYPHCSWASLLGSLSVLTCRAASFASNWLPVLNQRNGENGRRYYFMTSLHERMLPDVRIEPLRDRPHTTRTRIRSIKMVLLYRSLVVRKSFFGVCDKLRLKPACSTTETS